MSAQSWLVTHLCVNFIPNLEGVVRSCDLAYAVAIPWCSASLARSTPFIFESTLIRLLIWLSIYRRLLNQLCCLPFLILLKLSCHILLRLFAHWLTILILRQMSFIQLFMLPALELSSLKHWIQDIQSFQHHALFWKRLSNFFSKQIIIILVINFVILLLFLLQNFLRLFLWPAQRLLWAMSVTNTLTAMCGRVDFWGRVSCCAGYDLQESKDSRTGWSGKELYDDEAWGSRESSWGLNSYSENGGLNMSVLTILSAILSSALAPFLPESIPGNIQGLHWWWWWLLQEGHPKHWIFRSVIR